MTVTEHSQHGEEQHTPSREVLFKQLGERLRSTRQHRDISLEEAVHSLKLRQVYVEALENGDWDSLPGEVYAIGFLRQYAAYLDLDLSDDIHQLKSGGYELTKPETFPDPPIAPKKSWVIVALLVLLVVFVIFNIFNGSDHDKPAPDAPIATIHEMDEQPTPPEMDQQAPMPADAVDSTTPAPSDEKATPDEPASAEMVEHSYRFEAIGDDAWIQLYTAGDSPELIQEALLHAGESITISRPDPALLLTCGNPPALAIYFDGKMVIAAGRLGDTPGKVIRDYRLNFAED